MALTGTETDYMSVAVDETTARRAAAVVSQHVEGDELLLVLSRLGYQLKNPPVFAHPPVTDKCRNGHLKIAENRGRTSNGVAFCIPCDTNRKAARYQHNKAAETGEAA